MTPTEEMVRVAAIAVRQARNGCITPPENGTEYDEQLARAALSAALAAMWQPIETAPKDGTRVIVTGWNFGVVGSDRHIATAVWLEDRQEWSEVEEEGDLSTLAYLTHWMPLPPAPTQLSTRMGSEKTAEG